MNSFLFYVFCDSAFSLMYMNQHSQIECLRNFLFMHLNNCLVTKFLHIVVTRIILNITIWGYAPLPHIVHKKFLNMLPSHFLSMLLVAIVELSLRSMPTYKGCSKADSITFKLIKYQLYNINLIFIL